VNQDAARSADVYDQIRAMSEPNRLKIMRLLSEKRHCSRSLSLTLGISESAVSQHMTVLRQAGLVDGLRHGHHIHYLINKDAVEKISAELDRWIASVDNLGDCHEVDTCEYRLDDGSSGCLYYSGS
jgi:ArsR family transcriptional regulator